MSNLPAEWYTVDETLASFHYTLTIVGYDLNNAWLMECRLDLGVATLLRLKLRSIAVSNTSHTACTDIS